MTYLRIPSVLKLSIVLLTFLSCQSMSYLALDMRNSEKCVSAFYPEGTRLDVFYDVLDPKKDKLSLGVKINDSPLAQTKVIFTVRPKKLGSMPRVKNNIMTKELTETTGKFRYIGEGEGELEVCVRITEMPGKKYIKPALIGFRITESGELDEENIEAKPGLSPKEKETQDKAKTHLSEMERIMNHMIRETNLLLKNADLIKTDEAAFQKQSEEMNAASRWWPMLHVVVLLAMGFTQSNHVVKFFKGKHII